MRNRKVFENFIKDGVWQYMIDHAQVNQLGTICILFSVKDRKDFDKKINSRIYGKYTFQLAEAVEKEAQQLKETWRLRPKRKLFWFHRVHWYILRKLSKLVKNQLQYYQPDLVSSHIKKIKNDKKSEADK